MGSIAVAAQGSDYLIYAEKGLLAKFPELLKEYEGKRAAIISDKKVTSLYGEKIQDALQKAGLASCEIYAFENGEESKNKQVLFDVYDFLFEQRITRSDLVVALGGGVVGDLVGYAAATFLRGVPLIQIPTTLLAQIDSSVGGKVAINVSQGKNMIGTFYQPSLVLADIDFLNTLDKREFLAGLAELIKYGCIADESLFALCERGINTIQDKMSELVLRCCQIKANYVEADPYDHGLRMELNFGHSLAHAIEKEAGYGIYLHGEAVGIGMIAAAKWGESLGITPEGTAIRIRSLLESFGMKTRPPQIEVHKIAESMMGDKKAQSGDINLILLEKIGKARIEKMPKEKAKKLLEETWPWLIS